MAREKTNKITRSLRIDPELYDEAMMVAIQDGSYSDFSDLASQAIRRELKARARREARSK